METIAVNGASLTSMSLGSGDAAPVVMLHGLLSGNMASWYSAYATPLSQHGRVLLYDQRGHGNSSLPASGFDLDTQCDDLLAVLAHHGISGAVDLVGHSMGALIALHFALRHPQRVQRLVLVDGPMPAGEHVAPSLRGIDTPQTLSAYVAQQSGGEGGRRRERLHKRLQALFFDSTLVADVSAMRAEPEAALQALTTPTLLVYGRQSPCLSAGEYLSSVLPQARLALLDCGHYIPEEVPAALLAQLRSFLISEGSQAESAKASA